MSAVLVNQAYREQRVSGQQRYAHEIADRVLGGEVGSAAPDGLWRRSRVLAWLWVLLVLPMRARGRTVLSLTARAPLWTRRHVVVVHDLIVLRHPEWFSRTYVWTHAPLQRFQIRRAAALIAVSVPVAEELAAMGRSDAVVAPNAPSAVFSVPDDASSRVLADHGVEPGSYFLVVGSHDPRKNLARIAEAYAELPEQLRRQHRLVVVGGEASIYRAEQIEWPTGTVLAGYVTDEELRRLYRDAATVLFLSLSEGFGLPLVEACAAGVRSLLVSDIEVFRWICGEGARYVDPTSIEAIAEALGAQLREAPAPTMDLSRFSWEASAATVAQTCLAISSGGGR
jgi:glycosyltransferase involved in cell wall biosynthesis